ncbi:MAG: hypothetical protein FD154_2478 [Elusimicrobia bacterium]|nr:MAG: hypothetical protein FD154_2478 [Elusimicrobiota bacterium]
MVISRLIKKMGNKRAAPGAAAVRDIGGRVTLDHPVNGEKVTSPGYTLRVGTVGDAESVEISIDEGAWQPCRYSVGYWWYDWGGYAEGGHQAEVRACLKNGKVFSDGPVKFRVLLSAKGR